MVEPEEAEEVAEEAMEEEEAAVEEEALADEAEEEVPEEEAPPDEAEEEEVPAEEPAEEEAPPAEEPPKEEEEDEAGDDEPEVQEHLKDAVDGSLRLKRLLSQDEDDKAQKRRKLNNGDSADGDGSRPIVQAKVKQIMAKWQIPADAVMKYVLESLSLEELKALSDTNYYPNRNDTRRSPSEHAHKYVCELREKKLGTGGRTDVVSAFRLRWTLTIDAEKKLRGLSHKDLRYVVSRYDATTSLEDIIAEAQSSIPEENCTIGARPDGPGVSVMSRFNRLELIDPLADCAVFGDANLTFSVRLAKHRRDLGHVGRVIATTFEEIDTLRERYKEIDGSIQVLEDHYAEVYHGVDCTRIAVDPRFEKMEGSLGAVYYNFPHSGAIQGFFDGHPIVNWRHENLMRLFFRALRFFVKPGGVVKVSSNASAVGVRYSYIVGSAIENEFLHVETMPFLEWHLHRYGRSYGDRRDTYKRPDAQNNQSYNAQRADSDMVYCFMYAPTGKPLPKQHIRLPPTLKTLTACSEGPFARVPPQAKGKLAKQMHSRFVTEISGTHVG